MRWVIVVILSLATAVAFAQFTNPAIGPGSIGTIGPNVNTSSASPPPVGCGTGTIDLSTGCVQPMLGGL